MAEEEERRAAAEEVVRRASADDAAADFFRELELQEKKSSEELAEQMQAGACQLEAELEHHSNLACQMSERQKFEFSRMLAIQREQAEEIDSLKDALQREKSDKDRFESMYELERNARLAVEKKLEDVSKKNSLSHENGQQANIGPVIRLEQTIVELMEENEQLSSQLSNLRNLYEEREELESYEISKLKSQTCDRRNEYITMEVDYMQARNTIVKLESSLKAAEAQMKEYMEMEKEREYMSSAMSEEFSCMEETLRKTWEERKALEDRIISLETSNAELSASLKVEKMLRLKNFKQFSDDVARHRFDELAGCDT